MAVDGAFDLDRVSRSLERGPSEIWIARGGDAPALSYPEDGNDSCFEIEDRSFWFSHRNECVGATLARFPFEGPLLDVGGGNGAVSHALIARGLQAITLEPGTKGAFNARTRGVRDVVCSTLEAAAFEDASFGAAGLFDVIEHVEDDVALLREVRRVLRTDGVIAVTVPAFEWLWSSEDDVAGHYRRYTLGQLARVIERAGFEVAYATYFFAALVPPIFAFRRLRRLFGKREEAAVNRGAAQQHVPNAAARALLSAALTPERAWIARGRKIPFGTSCLAIARAKLD
jgi:SAM-dependent methyltransferase